MTNANSSNPMKPNYVKRDESVAEAKMAGMGKSFPWVAVIYPDTDDEFTMSFRTAEDAIEAAELWQAKARSV